jgi:hypothetical protein
MTQKDNFELVIRSVHVIINLRSAKMPLQQSKIEQDKTDNPMGNDGNKLGNTR